jgi:hypothetical protein
MLLKSPEEQLQEGSRIILTYGGELIPEAILVTGEDYADQLYQLEDEIGDCNCDGVPYCHSRFNYIRVAGYPGYSPQEYDARLLASNMTPEEFAEAERKRRR